MGPPPKTAGPVKADGRRDEKIRVVRVFSRLNVGGPSIHVVLLTAGLDPDHYDSTLVVGREEEHEGDFHALARSKGVAPVVVPTLGRSIRVLGDLRSFVALCRLFASMRPHVVHTHTAKAGALGRAAAWLNRVPIVVHTFHGTVFSGYFGNLASGIYAGVERALARVTDAMIAVSPAVAAELTSQRLRPKDGIHTIPLGLELDRFRDATSRGFLRARIAVSEDVRLIGCVGRLVPIKDIPTLLSAVQRVDDAHLVLVGDGPERARLESTAAELGITSRVHFTGFLSELERVYPDLDVAVNSSRNEGTPVALIEAMAAGVPVVATEVGGSIDLLQRGALGRLVPARDPIALADAISDVLSSPAAARHRAENARSAVLERYRAPRLLGDIDALYQRLLHEKGVAEPTSDAVPART